MKVDHPTTIIWICECVWITNVTVIDVFNNYSYSYVKEEIECDQTAGEEFGLEGLVVGEEDWKVGPNINSNLWNYVSLNLFYVCFVIYMLRMFQYRYRFL